MRVKIKAGGYVAYSDTKSPCELADYIAEGLGITTELEIIRDEEKHGQANYSDSE